MLSESSLKDIVKKLQTTEVNIFREYFQHLFLSNLYQFEDANKIFFKGGTALRIIYNSPRFSEDLDFTADIKLFRLKNLLEKVISKISLEGQQIKTLESKPTSGGFFAIYETIIYSIPVRIELNISLRKKQNKIISNKHLISNPFIPSYTVVALADSFLVKEKVEALLTRQKPRDFFDLYFILRNRLCINDIVPYQKHIIEVVSKQNEKSLVKELKVFLPKIYWNMLDNFIERIIFELKRI